MWPKSFKDAMVAANEEQSVLLFRNLHNTARVFKNKTAAEAAAIEKEKGTKIEFGDIAHLVSGARGRKAEQEGDKDGGIWSAGSAVGLVDDIPTCKELMDRFIKEAVETIEKRLIPTISKL